MALSPAQRSTLDAAARRIVPHAYDARGPAADIAALVESRLLAVRGKEGDLARALDVFGHRLAALATVGQPFPFARLSDSAQDSMLARWCRSRVPLQRTVFQGIRRVIMAVYYAEPAAHRSIGYLGALHTREPTFAFEGPIVGIGKQGAPKDHEPVARGARKEPKSRIEIEARAPEPAPPGVTRGAEVTGDLRLTADVVVIGTGAGGAVAAARLAEAGHDVIVLEEGGFWSADDFTEHEADMTQRLYAEGGLRATDDLGVAILQGSNVGGGTTVNWMIMLRPGDHVLEEWAHHFGTEAMSPRDMRPIFEQIEREVSATAVPEDAHSANNRLILDGASKLGWHAETAKINAKGCVRAGFCGYGCRYNAKQGTLVTFIPRALQAGARLYADTQAVRIEVLERGGRLPKKRVTATVRDPMTGLPRATLSIDAKVVVVAAGAVGTPLLLQRSGMGGGGVGRYLRLHPTTAVFGMYDRDIYSAAGIPLSVMCNEFGRANPDGYGYWIECPPLHPSLAAAAASGHGEAHRDLMLAYRRTGSMIALVRDGADRAVSNGSVTLDRNGTAHIRYALGKTDAQHMSQAIASAARLQLAAGAREVLTLHSDPIRIRREADLSAIGTRRVGPNELNVFSAHVNGTCRIGKNSRISGVSPDGERHGVPGVFVCDGSLLPTGLGVNPQETIMALATVIAGRIAARL